jgi:hypothetical protein
MESGGEIHVEWEELPYCGYLRIFKDDETKGRDDASCEKTEHGGFSSFLGDGRVRWW